jgi:hypothetical protein
MLVFAPFVNSYRRYVAGSQAPINLHWGLDNRTTGLRVPQRPAAARRVENRIAGADANPYLAIAASLAAGLAGIDDALAPTAPVDGSAYDHAHDLPRSFDIAHERLAQRARRLLMGADFRAGLPGAVKALEHDSFMREISAWERRLPATREALRCSPPHTQPGAGRPRSLETKVAHYPPACHPWFLAAGGARWGRLVGRRGAQRNGRRAAGALRDLTCRSMSERSERQ